MRSEEVSGPASEPVTTAEARAHVNLAASDTAHDTELDLFITAARQQWERDTQDYSVERVMKIRLGSFSEFDFPHRPIKEISSVTYYDLDNSSQTLSTSVYQLDTANNKFRLQYNQVWPATLERWDAVQVNYTLGKYTDESDTPAIAKQAILLLVGYYFDANRGDNDRPNDQKAYERLVAKHMRSSYP